MGLFKEITNENTECVICRITSAAGLALGGTFLIHHASNMGRVNMYIQTAIGTAFIGMGMLRALDFPPFGEFGIRGRKQKETPVE